MLQNIFNLDSIKGQGLKSELPGWKTLFFAVSDAVTCVDSLCSCDVMLCQVTLHCDNTNRFTYPEFEIGIRCTFYGQVSVDDNFFM